MSASPHTVGDAAGQTRLVGVALTAFGAACAGGAVALTASGVQMAFIDGPTMLVFSGGMAATGLWQLWLAGRIAER